MGFSVLMSVYRNEKEEYLQTAIESVFSQTLVPDELVLIQDGPLTEALNSTIERLKQKYPQIITFQFTENVKLGRALAKGVELCSNELIARMDTDDIAVKDRFDLQYHYMKAHPEIAACGGWIREFNDTGNYSKIKKMTHTEADIRKYIRYRNPLNHMTVMFRKSVILSVGNYRHFPLLEDYELWCRVLADGNKITNLPQVLVNMRTSDKMYDRRGGKNYLKQYQKLWKEQRKLGLLSWPETVMAFLLIASMTLQPSAIRKLMYHKVLRDKR